MSKKRFSWDDVKDSSEESKGKSSDLFMRFTPGNKYRVRFCGLPKQINVGWYERKRYIVPSDLINDFESYTGERVRTNYACNIIDRNDTKNGITRFKILEKGTSIFSALKSYYQEVGESPSGKEAPDFLINCIKGPDLRSTRYSVMNLPKIIEFNDKEKELINRPKNLKKEQLEKLPLGEQGFINLDIIYDEEKGRAKVLELISKSETKEETKKVENPKKDLFEKSENKSKKKPDDNNEDDGTMDISELLGSADSDNDDDIPFDA